MRRVDGVKVERIRRDYDFCTGNIMLADNGDLVFLDFGLMSRVDADICEAFAAVWKSTSASGAAVLARSSGEELASPRHRAGVASMAWRTTR